MPNSEAILLDTNAAIYVHEARPMLPAAMTQLRAAAGHGQLLVSPVTAWEIGLLVRKGRMEYGAMVADPRRWFHSLMASPAVSPAPFTPDIALDSATLPGELHDDPADRLLVATARSLGVPLMTRDRKLLAYGEAGHLRVLPC